MEPWWFLPLNSCLPFFTWQLSVLGKELGQLIPCRRSKKCLGLWETLILKVLAAVSVDVPTIPVHAATWSSAETELKSCSSAYMKVEMGQGQCLEVQVDISFSSMRVELKCQEQLSCETPLCQLTDALKGQKVAQVWKSSRRICPNPVCQHLKQKHMQKYLVWFQQCITLVLSSLPQQCRNDFEASGQGNAMLQFAVWGRDSLAKLLLWWSTGTMYTVWGLAQF